MLFCCEPFIEIFFLSQLVVTDWGDAICEILGICVSGAARSLDQNGT